MIPRSDLRERDIARPGRVDGAVTIMMTVVFLLIVSLVLVGLESARQQGAVAMVRMNVQTASESVLGSYYAPLFDDYGIYGLYDVDIREELAKCAEASAQPSDGKPTGYSGESRSYYSYAYEIADVALTKSVGLLQGGAAICKNQMIEEGAVSGVQELAEMLLKAVHLLKDSEASLTAMEREQKLELELAKFDEKLLALMKYLDGVPTDSAGVKLSKDGTFTPEKKFVKRAVRGPVSAKAVHMNNETFYGLLQPHYTALAETAEAVRAELERITGAEVNDTVSIGHMKLITAVTDACEPTESAIKLVDDLIAMQDKYRPLVKDFESYVESVRSMLNNDTYQALQSSIKTMKRYLGDTGDGTEYPFRRMKETLESNLVILKTAKEKLLRIPRTFQEWKELYRTLPEVFREYRLTALELDYSSVKISAGNSSFWTAVKDVVANGITGGVYPKDISLSSSSLRWETDRPSAQTYGEIESLYLVPALPTEGRLSADFLKRILEGNFFRTLLDSLADGVVALSEKLLLVTYFNTHMRSFADGDLESDSVLDYELEYLLYGKNKDSDNQKAATRSILGLRVVMNLVHVFTNSAKRAEALVIAAELLSLLPLPFLIKIAQYLIMAVWAIQNAYLETAELIQGKAVPLVVNSGNFQLSLSDAVMMTRAKRIEKAQEYVSPAGIGLKYKHYLLLFLLFRNSDTSTLRALDLIQANIRMKYDDHFRIRDCIYGFEAEVTATIPSLYTDVFFGEDPEGMINGFEITEKCAVSY
ncbi:MAG: hypothetical protein IKX54_00370 [Lachnospiraceae bacterium]|nr:hypothetical protein [Lachnospiraceae bacterium]